MDFERIDTETIGRYDLTPLFHDRSVFAQLIEELAEPFRDETDVVVGLEALGFILGSAVAFSIGSAFVPMRKQGKLPLASEKVSAASFVDYTGTQKGFEMRRDAIKKDDRVLIVDDWIETGEQVRAAISIIEAAGGRIIGVSVIGVDRTDRTQDLFERFEVSVLKES